MMENEQEKWVNEVMDSLQGMQRAAPPVDLFEAIEAQITKPRGKGKIIPMRQIRWSIAIAAVLLLLNVVAIRSYTVNNNTGYASVDFTGDTQLVSDFKIYE